MKITEALVVLFLVLFCYLFLDKFLFRGELGEICFGPTCRALARWHRRQADRLDPPRRRRRRPGLRRRSADASTRRVTPHPAQGEQFRQERPYICTGKRRR